MNLKTPICELLNIQIPIVQAGMGGNASPPALAAAVSNAGGLGVLGAASTPAGELREWIRETRELTDKPFGVDTLLPASVRRGTPGRVSSGLSPEDQLSRHQAFADEFLASEGLEQVSPNKRIKASEDFFAQQMEVIIEEKVSVYISGLGSPKTWVGRMHANDTVVIAMVGSTKHVPKVVDAGVDVIVAQGHDGGGHNSPVGTMALIPQAVDAAGDIPVLGAGGICDGRGVAAALMLGAQGAWVGSAFLATHESGIQEFQKRKIIESRDYDTVITRSFTGKPCRLIRNRWAQAYVDAKLDPLPMPYQRMVSDRVEAAAYKVERGDVAPGAAGQGIGLIREIRPAAEVLIELAKGAEEVLARANSFIS